MVAAVTVAMAAFGVPALIAQAGAAAPGYVPHSALINGASVTTSDGITEGGTPISLEQYAAQKAGFDVTVVSGATWAGMSAADFAKYQVLIVGDPFCGTIPGSVTSSASTWAPVVMGTGGGSTTVGNRSLVGTDPEDHYAFGGGGAPPTDPSNPSTAGAEHLVQGGITFAGAVDGATGFYFDTTCSDNGAAIPALNMLSSAGTGFTEDTSPPCGGSVAQIASNPAFADLTDHDIEGWGCSVHTTYPTYPTDWQPLAVATDTRTKPTCGTDPNTGSTACGEAYVLVAGEGVVVTSPDLTLTPATSTSPAGGTHTVTATVNHAGADVPGVLVTFDVAGQNAGVSGTCAPVSCETNASGQVTFTYSDVNGAGTDTINASITLSGTTEHATASQVWGGVSTRNPTTTTLTANRTQVQAGAPVTLTATVSPIPTSGTVDFSDGGSPIANCQNVHVNASGVARCTTYFTTAGSHPIVAEFSGNSTLLPSTSNTVVITVVGSCLGGYLGRGLTLLPYQVVCLGPTAVVDGPVSLTPHSSLYVHGSHLGMLLGDGGANTIYVCDASISGAVNIADNLGTVTLGGSGGRSGCGGNTIGGSVTLDGNHGTLRVIDNTIGGSLYVQHNTGAVIVHGNTVSGWVSVQAA